MDRTQFLWVYTPNLEFLELGGRHLVRVIICEPFEKKKTSRCVFLHQVTHEVGYIDSIKLDSYIPSNPYSMSNLIKSH